MVFDYEQSVALADVPVLPVEDLRRDVLEQVRDGGRLLALFGLPGDGGTGLCAIVAHSGERFLRAMRTAPLTQYVSLTPDCPQAHLFERELWEQWNIRPEGHPWLKPVRFVPHGCLTATPGERPGPAQLTHYRVDGEEVHEVAVGPVHAGVIEPGHFRFQCYGENVMHLEISLGFQHRDVERRLLGGPHPIHARLMECVAGDTSIGHATAHATLLERLAQADDVMYRYISERVGELDGRKRELAKEISERSLRKEVDCQEITGHLTRWEELSFEDKRQTLDQLIKEIYATSDKVQIEWRI